jgi:predicted phosphodiesterase
MIHDAGPADGRLARLKRRFPDTQAVVFGHSHQPLLEQDGDGFAIFNPGSPTERRRAPHHTMGAATAADGRIAFELVALD